MTGRAMKTLSPLIKRIEADIMGSDLLHADDAPSRAEKREEGDVLTPSMTLET